jgi:hypothetical protein
LQGCGFVAIFVFDVFERAMSAKRPQYFSLHLPQCIAVLGRQL